jgi:hypothetical protein
MEARSRSLLLVALLLTASLLGPACATGSAGSSPPPAAAPAKEKGRIEGTLERSPEDPQQKKRMKIWGQVKLIMDSEHGDLPQFQTVSKGGIGDPVAHLANHTDVPLTIWFSGPCAHTIDVPAKKTILDAFCAGSYNIAAVIADKKFLPLVREKQDFEGGVAYSLDFFVLKPPKK